MTSSPDLCRMTDSQFAVNREAYPLIDLYGHSNIMAAGIGKNVNLNVDNPRIAGYGRDSWHNTAEPRDLIIRKPVFPH